MGQKSLNNRQMQRAETEFMQKWLAYLGPNDALRVQGINTLFEERTATVYATHYADLSQKENWQYVFFTVTRSLASMNFRELTFLRLAELLNSAYNGSHEQYRRWRAALIWGDGKGSTDSWQTNLEKCSSIEQAVTQALPKVDATFNAMQQELRRFLSRQDLPRDFRTMLEEFAEQVTPAGGAGWLKPSEIATSPFRPQSNYELFIGSFPDGTPLTYSGEASMVTIAPSGTGKTQCNVIPNLLYVDWASPCP